MGGMLPVAILQMLKREIPMAATLANMATLRGEGDKWLCHALWVRVGSPVYPSVQLRMQEHEVIICLGRKKGCKTCRIASTLCSPERTVEELLFFLSLLRSVSLPRKYTPSVTL